MWCLIVKCHFVNGLYIQTSLDVNCLPATSDHCYHTYVQKWWSGKKKKKKIFLYFHIREVLSHSRECGSRAASPGGSRMIREGSHVCFSVMQTIYEDNVDLMPLTCALGKKKNMCVFQVSALKKLGMVGRHNILFYPNILYRNCIFQYIFPHSSTKLTRFCSQFTIKCLGLVQKPR